MIIEDGSYIKEKVSGLVFVGDPHISSYKPGRRTDSDWPNAILNKIKYIINYANNEKMKIIFLGDLFETNVEPDEFLKVSLARILLKCEFRPMSNVGNHDIGNKILSDSDSISLFGLMDIIDLPINSGLVAKFDIDGMIVGLGMTPFGQDIPNTVEEIKKEVDKVLWVTHHDLDFGNTYPGCKPLFELRGCDVAINGHIHQTKKIGKVGGCTWINPGNINRQTIDLIDEIPSFLVAKNINGKLNIKKLNIPYEKEKFNKIGYIVNKDESLIGKNIDYESIFVSLLEVEESSDMRKSDDGSIVLEEIEKKFVKENTSDDVREIILSLLSESIKRHRENKK